MDLRDILGTDTNPHHRVLDINKPRKASELTYEMMMRTAPGGMHEWLEQYKRPYPPQPKPGSKRKAGNDPPKTRLFRQHCPACKRDLWLQYGDSPPNCAKCGWRKPEDRDWKPPSFNKDNKKKKNPDGSSSSGPQLQYPHGYIETYDPNAYYGGLLPPPPGYKGPSGSKKKKSGSGSSGSKKSKK